MQLCICLVWGKVKHFFLNMRAKSSVLFAFMVLIKVIIRRVYFNYLHGFNDLVVKSLCSLGLGCDDCNGILAGLQPVLGGTINSMGLGLNCGDDGEK